MIKGQLLVYRYNKLNNAIRGAKRNQFRIQDVTDVKNFRDMIENALDEIPPGCGYVLIKYNAKLYTAERNVNNPSYTKREINYHPLMNHFTI